ncbi:MAG: hypothetical protein FWH32_08375 [Clostridiales bacterium]|nr:hypothetical protein [Clostridiales bacterium]
MRVEKFLHKAIACTLVLVLVATAVPLQAAAESVGHEPAEGHILDEVRTSFVEAHAEETADLEAIEIDASRLEHMEQEYEEPEPPSGLSALADREPSYAGPFEVGDTRMFRTRTGAGSAQDKCIAAHMLGRSAHVNVWALDDDDYHEKTGTAHDASCRLPDISTAYAQNIATMFDPIYARMTSAGGFAPHAGTMAYPGSANLPAVGDLGGDSRVNFLLYDIHGDGGGGGGYTPGFFWATDFFTYSNDGTDIKPDGWNGPDNRSFANGLDMLHVDIGEGQGFNALKIDATEGERLSIYSTLAHEFQHMLFYIHFGIYDPDVGGRTYTWLNEMLSELAGTYFVHEGAEIVPVERMFHGAANIYPPGSSGYSDFLNFASSKSISMAKFFAMLMYKTYGTAFASGIYDAIMTSYPTASDATERAYHRNRISADGHDKTVGSLLQAATGIGVGDDTLHLAYALFMESFAADGGLVRTGGSSVQTTKIVENTQAWSNLWAVRPSLGSPSFNSGAGLNYNLSSYAPAPVLQSGDRATLNGYGAAVPARGPTHEMLFRLDGAGAGTIATPILTISLEDASEGALYYLAVPRSATPPGSAGADIHPLRKDGGDNVINTYSGTAYLFVSSFYQSVDTELAFSWSESDPDELTGLATIAPTAPRYGDTLEVWINSGNSDFYDYQWRVDGVQAGTGADTYEIVASDIGKVITVDVTSPTKSGVLTGRTTPVGKAINPYVAAPPTPAETDAYRISLAHTDGYEYSNGGFIWQDSPVFTGLQANTSYLFYQRVKATATHTASDMSVAMQTSTMPPLTNEDAVAETKAALTWNAIRGANLLESDVATDLSLPLISEYGASISWSSDHEAVSPAGRVTVPVFAFGMYDIADAHITLTAVITRGSATDTVVFNLTVLAVVVDGFTPVNGIHYTTTPLNPEGWTNRDFVITARAGYSLGLVGDPASDTWLSFLAYTVETHDGNVDFYMRDMLTGEISQMSSEAYKIDRSLVPGDPSRIILKNYLVLNVGEDSDLDARAWPDATAEVSLAALNADVDDPVATVTADGVVTAVRPGSVVIKAWFGDFPDGSYIAAECRVDVVDDALPIHQAVSSVRLLQTAIRVNALSENYARLPIQLILAQNAPLTGLSIGALDTSRGAAGNALAAVDSVKLTNDPAGYFTLKTIDDKFVEFIPTQALISQTKAKRLTSALEVTVTGAGGTETHLTQNLRIDIARTWPKLKARAVRFNSFFPGDLVPISITTNIGAVTSIELNGENRHNPMVEFIDGALRLKDAGQRPTRLAFRVKVSDFGDRWFDVVMNASVRRTNPVARLSSASVTMYKSAEVRLTGAGVPRITGITSGHPDFTVTYPTPRHDSFHLQYRPGLDDIVSAKARVPLTFSFAGTESTRLLRLTANAPPRNESVKLSRSTVTLVNSSATHMHGDSVTVTAVTKPVDAVIASVAAETPEGASALSIDHTDKSIRISIEPYAAAGAYKVLVTTDKGRRALLNVRVIDGTGRNTASIAFRARGKLDVINPGSSVTLTPRFTSFNYAGGNVMIEDSDIGAAFEVASGPNASGVVTLRMKDLPIKPRGVQTFILIYEDAMGNRCNGTVNITPRQGKARFTQSAKSVALQRNDVYSESRIDVSVRTPATAKISHIEVRPTRETAKAANHAEAFTARRLQDGSWAIGFKDSDIDSRLLHTNALKSKTTSIKLNIYIAGSDAVAGTVTVKVAVG